MVSGVEMTLFSDAYPWSREFTCTAISIPIIIRRIKSKKWVFTLCFGWGELPESQNLNSLLKKASH